MGPKIQNSSKVSTGVWWTYLQVKLDPLLDGSGVECILMRFVLWPIQMNSYTCTAFLRKPAKEELMEEDEDVCSILGELEDLQESSAV